MMKRSVTRKRINKHKGKGTQAGTEEDTYEDIIKAELRNTKGKSIQVSKGICEEGGREKLIQVNRGIREKSLISETLD